ncbi:MAG TPA: hypothetical protein VEX68_24065 [Bryobacteraceae bacterium]|nr:hypothetical protein [Bryobacteraceae bacterium]
MENQSLHHPSADSGTAVWVILAALLIVGALTGVGALKLITAVQQPQLPTGNQSAPTSR